MPHNLRQYKLTPLRRRYIEFFKKQGGATRQWAIHVLEASCFDPDPFTDVFEGEFSFGK